MRLAWPATEAFHAQLPRIGQVPAMVGLPHGAGGERASGIPAGGLSGQTLVLCTMFKNESPYLDEWLEYHRLLGVSKVRW